MNTKKKDTKNQKSIQTVYEAWDKAPTRMAKAKIVAESGISKAAFYAFASVYSEYLQSKSNPVVKGELQELCIDKHIQERKLSVKSILGYKFTINKANNWFHATLIAMHDFDLSFREKQDLIYSICKHILSQSEDSELKSYVTEMVDYFKDRTAISDHFQRASFWRSLLLLLRGYRVHTLEAREYIQHPSRYGHLRTQENISDRVKEAHQLLVQEFRHTKKGGVK